VTHEIEPVLVRGGQSLADPPRPARDMRAVMPSTLPRGDDKNPDPRFTGKKRHAATRGVSRDKGAGR
jgi:hypothetical protein